MQGERDEVLKQQWVGGGVQFPNVALETKYVV